MNGRYLVSSLAPAFTQAFTFSISSWLGLGWALAGGIGFPPFPIIEMISRLCSGLPATTDFRLLLFISPSYESRRSPAFGLLSPWHCKQYFAKNGCTSSL